MENVILIVLLILALALIGVVLLQRSEGGGLGIGGGGGGAMTGRSAATAMTKLTWILGAAFMAMSIMMTVLGANSTRDASVVDTPGVEVPAEDGALPSLPGAGDLLPPSAEDGSLTPPRAD